MTIKQILVILSICVIALSAYDDYLESDSEMETMMENDSDLSESESDSDDFEADSSLKQCITKSRLPEAVVMFRNQKKVDRPYFDTTSIKRCWKDYERVNDFDDSSDSEEDEDGKSVSITITIGAVIDKRYVDAVGKKTAEQQVDAAFEKADRFFKSCCSKLSPKDKELKVTLKRAFTFFADEYVLSGISSMSGTLDHQSAWEKASKWYLANLPKEKAKKVDTVAIFTKFNQFDAQSMKWRGVTVGGGGCDAETKVMIVQAEKNMAGVLAHELGHQFGVAKEMEKGELMTPKGIVEKAKWTQPEDCCQRICNSKTNRELCKFKSSKCGVAYCPCKDWLMKDVGVCKKDGLMEELCVDSKELCEKLKDPETGSYVGCSLKAYHCLSKELPISEISQENLNKYCPKLGKKCTSTSGTFSCDHQYDVHSECPRDRKRRYLGYKCKKHEETEVFSENNASITVHVPKLICKHGPEYGDAWSTSSKRLIKSWIIKNASRKAGGCLNR